LVQPSSWRRMGLRWTAAATSMSARCRGPTGRKLSETSHGRISCARCTSSGRWYKKVLAAGCATRDDPLASWFSPEQRNEETQSSAGVDNIADSFCSDRPVGRAADQHFESGCGFGEFGVDTGRHGRSQNHGTNRVSAAVRTPFRWSL